MKPEPTTCVSQSETLISYIEVWTLPESSEEGQEPECLHLDSAIAIQSGESRTVQPSETSLTKGTGIAGSAWQQETAVLLAGEHSATLQTAARDADLNICSLLAIPVFRDYEMVNVVVFGFTTGYGGLEIWSRDDRDELAISGSYYHGLNSFEYISQYVRFPKGAGLPGNSWKNNRPGFLSNPNTNPNFIRSFDRDPAKIVECLGMPIGREYGFPKSILLMLSDETTPIAKSIDVWQCKTDDSGLKFESSRNACATTDPDWCQKICDQFQERPTAKLLTKDSGSLLPNQSCPAGVFVPFFEGKQITDVLALLF